MRVQQRIDEPLVRPLCQRGHLVVFCVVLTGLVLAHVTGLLAWLWMWTMTWMVLVVLFWGVQIYTLLQ